MQQSEHVTLVWTSRNTVAWAKRKLFKKESKRHQILTRRIQNYETGSCSLCQHYYCPEWRIIYIWPGRMRPNSARLPLSTIFSIRWPPVWWCEECILYSEGLTELDIHACTIGSSDSSTGADGISDGLQATCWTKIEPHVTRLFRTCLRLGYLPYFVSWRKWCFFQILGVNHRLWKDWGQNNYFLVSE